MNKPYLLEAVCVISLALLPLSAQAVPVIWELDGHLLQGGTASGSFIYDADTALFSDIMLTTSADSPTGGLTFTEFSAESSDSDSGLGFMQSGVVSGELTIALFLKDIALADLTNTGGTRFINTDPVINHFAEMNCFAPCTGSGSSASNWDKDATNTLSTTHGIVPVPAAVWLFGSGLIGLIGIARRKA